MEILIIESETYLAASLAQKLEMMGYSCTIGMPNVKYEDDFHVVLLGGFFDTFKIIKEHPFSVIILLANYVNSDTSAALKAGASDYILKPVIIEELHRKIELHTKFKQMKCLNESYESILLEYTQNKAFNAKEVAKLRLPLQIITDDIQNSDIFVFFLAKVRNMSFIKYNGDLNLLKNKLSIVYFGYFDELGSKEKEIIKESKNKLKIIRSSQNIEGFNRFEIKNKDKIELMSVDKYIKYCISEQQSIYNDTQLAEILGISRKSLWEKRKRYGITKDK